MLDTQPSSDKGASFFNRVLPALLQVVVGIGGVALLTHLIDDGSTRTWPRWQHNLASTALFPLLAIGIRPIIRFSGGDERWAWLAIVMPAWVALTFFLGWWLQALTGLSMWSTVIGIHALVVAYGAWKRPWWFRDRLSDLIGDTGARLVYAALVIAMIGVAVRIAKLGPRLH